MAFNKDQFKIMIVDVLAEFECYSYDAVNLLLGTAAQESAFGTYLFQLGGGPACGVFQMEPATERDIWLNFLNYRDILTKRIDKICHVNGPSAFALRTNLAYQIIMTRCHYLRVKAPIPGDLLGYAKYWKNHYNTIKGKGTEEEFVHNYKKYVL